MKKNVSGMKNFGGFSVIDEFESKLKQMIMNFAEKSNERIQNVLIFFVSIKKNP